MLLSTRKSDRMRFCELSKAGLHLSYFLLFFQADTEGIKKKKRCGIFYMESSENLILFT